MRLGPAIVVASMAALLTLAAPGLARNSDTPKPSVQPAAASCHSYQQATDKSWIELPCQELGAPGASRAQIRDAKDGPTDAVSRELRINLSSSQRAPASPARRETSLR